MDAANRQAIIAGFTDPIMQYFAYAHLPEPLQAVSTPFANLAILGVTLLPPNPEREAGLRKLLEARDCFVRAAMFRLDGMPGQNPAEPKRPRRRVSKPGA